ncbi:uncharacterized protein LOC117170204 [Belonocnema kinseyi]|uniref:uncharacterized protein LOC117170204 n=1 Tax=Belonocnema kinseyi TaxID=2817044 RepID=UPI00143CDA1C|nr:uncharacterized protein LOC117170204 [Belonocnema kinseyi]
MEGVGLSSGYSLERQGLRRRATGPFQTERAPPPPLKRHVDLLPSSYLKIDYMTHEVRLRIVGGKVVQASFPNNTLPEGPDFYKHHNFLVRLAKIAGHTAVIYVRQDGSLMGVRPPNPTSADMMEPDGTTWFIAYAGECFKVKVRPDQEPHLMLAVEIELKSGNVITSTDTVQTVTFPWVIFNLHRTRFSSKITGALLPKPLTPPRA